MSSDTWKDYVEYLQKIKDLMEVHDPTAAQTEFSRSSFTWDWNWKTRLSQHGIIEDQHFPGIKQCIQAQCRGRLKNSWEALVVVFTDWRAKIIEASYSQILNVVQSSSSACRCLISNHSIHYIITLLSFFQQQIKDKVFSLDRRHKQCRLCQDESLNEDDPSDTLISMTILTASILLSKNRAKIMVCPSLNRFCEQKHLLTLQTWAIAMKPGVS